ncbi:cell division protein ZapE [Geminicoccus roseus]|uniref:cell division protein ZapE n=1 Tax=Geminicoccus roseus TaxID=404900 RepID=UPI00040F4A6F|nr:cell division protein ZapE [Geminicoccus roseus]
MTGPLALYREKIATGALKADPDQERAAQRLQRLHDDLTAAPDDGGQGGFWSGLFKRKAAANGRQVRGVYLQGAVGRGKSMLMDLFVASSPEPKTRRVHFHAFMLEVQRRLHELRQDGGSEDPVGQFARTVASETRLLCFDEFHVVNIADAMILGRLFTGLFDAGVVIVATSNWPPERLYWNGLNRDRFLPFIDLLQSKVDVVSLDGPVDYRVERLRDLNTWFSPLGEAAGKEIERLFLALSDGSPGSPVDVPVGSRTLKVARADGPIALFDFPELCARPLGAADYLAIGSHFRVVFLTNVPILAPARRNEARRFMTLVDVLYESRRMLVVSADGRPDQLYPVGEGAFEFQRTVSRLMEMQSTAWLEMVRSASGDLPDFAPFALTSDLN